MRQASGTVRAGWVAALVLWLGSMLPVSAAPDGTRIRAVASFSILGDLVRQVGGTHVTVTSLVGPDSDAHGFSPAPGDAKTVARADIVFVNGLGLEGWLDRLIRASGTRAPVVIASRGVAPIAGEGSGEDRYGHSAHERAVDPHAWQSVANAKIYVANIRDGLRKADPAHAADYDAAAAAYTVKLDELDGAVRAAVAKIPSANRQIITTHDAFGYFAAAYGLRFIAPQGVSTDSEASPRDVAAIIQQIRRDKVPAVFLENISDPRQMAQIARESGARRGGKVYSDALSGPDGPAPTYLDMMRSNLKAFDAALAPG